MLLSRSDVTLVSSHYWDDVVPEQEEQYVRGTACNRSMGYEQLYKGSYLRLLKEPTTTSTTGIEAALVLMLRSDTVATLGSVRLWCSHQHEWKHTST